MDWQRESRKRQWLREGMRLTDAMMKNGINSVEARVLRDIITPKWMRTATSSPEVSRNDPRLQQLAQPVIESLREMELEAVRLGLITQASFDRYEGAYLHRSYMKHEEQHDTVSRAVEKFANRQRKKHPPHQSKNPPRPSGANWQVD